MRQLALHFTAIAFFSPLFAFAHGEEIIFTSSIYFVSIIVFLLLLSSSKLESSFKMELVIIYILSLGMIVLFTWKIPYNDNRNLLDTIRALGSGLVTFLAYFFSKRAKKDRAQ